MPTKRLQIIGEFPSEPGSKLPPVTEQDNGKVATVVNGQWAVSDLPLYEGEYEITPSTRADQTLKTAQKLMNADVKISKIPYAEVSNTAGGRTATIGNEV